MISKTTLALVLILLLQFTHAQSTQSIYDIRVEGVQTEDLNLRQYEGKKKILFVNIATKCGFTYQLNGMQKLSEQYGDKLAVIGLPCNQFMFQSPGSSLSISKLCSLIYGVNFPLSVKLSVKGENQHELYAWLTKKSLNGVMDSRVKWNFQKYLIDEYGQFVEYWGSATKPMSNEILKHLE